MLALVNYHRAAISVNATTFSDFGGMALAMVQRTALAGRYR
jgi:hypothetical protein